MSQRTVSDVLTRVREVWPLWWLNPPPTAQPFETRGRVSLTSFSQQNSILLCQMRAPKIACGVFFYELWSYITTEGQTSTQIEHLGAFTGQIGWYPVVSGKQAVNVISRFPQSNGYIGGARDKQSGYCEAILPYQNSEPLPVIVKPSQSFGLGLELIELGGGDAIPQGEDRFFSGRIWGWFVQTPPPEKYAPVNPRQPAYPNKIL